MLLSETQLNNNDAFEITDHELFVEDNTCRIVMRSKRSEDIVPSIVFSFAVDPKFEYDGGTRVPYGSTTVTYEEAGYSLEDVVVSSVEPIQYELDGEEVSEDEFKNFCHINSDEELAECIAMCAEEVEAQVESYVCDNPEEFYEADDGPEW